jgi:2-polyprenyl-3-methyl-5-hydroxy-6-metoxy-1,4-benzoquinol methylase
MSIISETTASPRFGDSEERQVWGWRSAERAPHHSYLLPAITALMPGGDYLSVLDAGCGNGFIAAQIARLGHQVTAIDSAADGIELARAAHRGVNYEIASVYEHLARLMPHEGWDLILSCEVIEHLHRPLAFLRNMNRHLREGGSLILTTPYHGYLKNLAISLVDGWDWHHTALVEGGHIKFFSQRTLSAALTATGFASPTFRNAGRLPFLWKSMVCRSIKQSDSGEAFDPAHR